MKAKDQFIEWLRDKILQNPQEPPAQAWQEISEALDLEEGWQKVDEELELNTIWSKIDSRLHTYGAILKYERIGYGISGAFALLFLLVVVIWDVPTITATTVEIDSIAGGKSLSLTLPTGSKQNRGDLEYKPNPLKNNNARQRAKEETTATTLNISAEGEILKESNPPVQQKKTTQNINIKKKKEDNSLNPAISGAFQEEEALNFTQHSALQQSLSLENGLVPDIYPRNYLINDPENISLIELPFEHEKLRIGDKGKEEGERPGKFNYPSAYFGAGSAVKLSWLLNNKTLHALEKNSLLSAAPSYHTDWYILYGAKISDRTILQTDLYARDVVGQTYNEYRNGQYGEVKDVLSYQSIGLSLSHLSRQIGYGKYPTFKRFSTGIYGGRLRQAEELSFAGNSDRTNEYAKYHLGIMGGYEYDTFLGKNFILSYGLRSRLDLLNIYSGNDAMPAAFKKTRAVSVDFSFSLKYVLKR